MHITAGIPVIMYTILYNATYFFHLLVSMTLCCMLGAEKAGYYGHMAV